MRVRVELAPARILSLAVQCPKCENWFRAEDITYDELRDEYDIYTAQFECPVCGKIFGSEETGVKNSNIVEELGYPEVYKDCLVPKIKWEKEGT